MSPHSSSCSWSTDGAGGGRGGRGAGAGGAADVIDLDRFMRGVRPSLPRRSDDHIRGQLVVDSGGAGRKSARVSSGDSTPPRRAGRRHKRPSHDSGLSDGSYVATRHRLHRHATTLDGNTVSPRVASCSTSSMHAFRAACEHALRDQQRQLARVALICEQLGASRDREREREREHSVTPNSTDISSSSRSTRDLRRKEKRRVCSQCCAMSAEECKTYKIIMRKLDELNRLFVARGSARPHPAYRPTAPSVSVSDKVVATEPENKKEVSISQKQMLECCGDTNPPRLVERAVGSEQWSTDGRRSPRLPGLRTVTRAHALDIVPRDAVALNHSNIVADSSVVGYETSGDGSDGSGSDPRCTFNVDDPVHLYTRAKRLQAMQASPRRAPPAGGERGRGPSLCALCRRSWRQLRRYLAAQIFSCPPTDGACTYT
ncbi:uncharacterized protein LOC128202082 [Galleria mellonella]|uniref:Uncharacterized protein LOC128202082 n=1 Tax=Galleria mellonella TaxID=7137 RepID=A0ABM3N0A5_GALME|nr:uncharacterized protein LOC128202082 [Galleria mellonella]